MIHYLIDAYNLINQDTELSFQLSKSPVNAAESLFKLLAKFASHHSKNKFTLIFDGDPFDIHSPFENVYIEGSGKHTADDIIKGYISVAVNAKNYIVVSSDREILSFAKLHYSDYFLSEQFILELRMFNNSSLDESELDIYKNFQKDETKPTDLLLKYFNDNPIDPNTLEEVKSNNIQPKNIENKVEKSKTETKKQTKMIEEKDLSNDELMKLINHFS